MTTTEHVLRLPDHVSQEHRDVLHEVAGRNAVFSLAGRVRPYHKHLPWELRAHPLPGWEAERLLGLVVGTLDGDPAAIRETFSEVVARCSAFDAERPRPVLGPVVDGWGSELELFRP
ncbi:hypothetical protein QWJ41_02030 [Nocardioides sp. SOB44]|uniref:Uncharacterized protein n=1 Tax=Nocardioides cremeus TaxID=3058044 RepID=A0ABT8TKK9_9ACTN|nr:hypothetical protein [Nocardioides cremeus]MDO3394491.1 hypothetical protein [Nocardioides cremeus]